MSDNHAQIMALLDKRMKEAEQKITYSPQFQRMKAHLEHTFMAHGSAEVCRCPEWEDAWKPFLNDLDAP